MENDVDLAIRHALDLAKTRGGQLAALTLRGTGVADHVHEFARAALHRAGVLDTEVRFFPGAGPVSLVSVELDPAP